MITMIYNFAGSAIISPFPLTSFSYAPCILNVNLASPVSAIGNVKYNGNKYLDVTQSTGHRSLVLYIVLCLPFNQVKNGSFCKIQNAGSQCQKDLSSVKLERYRHYNSVPTVKFKLNLIKLQRAWYPVKTPRRTRCTFVVQQSFEQRLLKVPDMNILKN